MRIPEEIYQTILRVMPIPCVDLVVQNGSGEILLVRRINEPARGEWWFPGGRIHFGELREVAARRKLAEECGLGAAHVEELWTEDVILPLRSSSDVSHGITTVYAMSVQDSPAVRLDKQARDFAWKNHAAWEKEPLHPFVRRSLCRSRGASC